MRLFLALVFVSLVGAWSCGGPEPLKVVPPRATLAPGQALQFSVVPTTTSVTWSVQEAGGGTVTATGLYTAPATWGTFHVVATASPTVSASATVTVTSPVAITAPTPQDTVACEAKQLVATVTGSADTQVVWGGLDPSCGTLTAAGIITPARVTGQCTVSAQAHADPTKVTTVNVNIAPERVIGVAIVPQTATVGVGGTQQFASTVTTSCGTFAAGQ